MREDIDLDNDIDKVYRGIIQEDLPSLTKGTSPNKDIINSSLGTGSFKDYGTYKEKTPSIDAFTDGIRRMRERQEEGLNPFIYWM